MSQYFDFSHEHWTHISTNHIIEELNRDIRRRTCVAGTLSDGNSALMLLCARLRQEGTGLDSISASSSTFVPYLSPSFCFKNLYGLQNAA